MPQLTTSSIPATPALASGEFYRWQAPGHNLAVEIQLDVIDRLDREVVQTFRAITSRGSEIGGLLLGSWREDPDRTIVITDYEAVACDYRRGPLYLLTEEEQSRLEEAVLRHRSSSDSQRTVVGYFRSNTRKELALDDEDVAILKRYFAGFPSVCLLIKPFASKANLAGFFLWEGDEPQRKSPLTFPFNKAELVKLMASTPAPRTETPSAPAPAPASVPETRPTIQVRIALTETGPARKGETEAVPQPDGKPSAAPTAVPLAEEVAERISPVAAADGKASPSVPPASDGKAVAVPVSPEFVPATEEPLAPAEVGETAPAVEAPPRLFESIEERPGLGARLKRFRMALGLAAVVVLGVAGAFVWNSSRGSAPAPAADSSALNLKVERSGGQLLLSWNRSLPLLQTAQRAILSITDGDHREDVEMDLGQLRSGSIVYSPITNDVSFRLEVTDLKNGKSVSESVRVLGGRPSPTGPPAEASTPSAPEPTEASEQTKPARPAPRNMAPLPAPSKESLAARLSPAEPIIPAGSPEVVPPVTVPVATHPAAAPPPAPPAPPPSTSSSTQQLAPAVAQTKPAASEQPAAPPPKPAASSQAAPQATEPPMRVGGQVQEARLIQRREPVYPPLARQARIQGVVKLEAVIGPDGRVEKVQAISGPPLLRQAAIDAVRQWVYEPSRLNGQPVRTTTQIEINFTLGR
jgi:TonB family protein